MTRANTANRKKYYPIIGIQTPNISNGKKLSHYNQVTSYEMSCKGKDVLATRSVLYNTWINITELIFKSVKNFILNQDLLSGEKNRYIFSARQYWEKWKHFCGI